jgi:hypothetical protein
MSFASLFWQLTAAEMASRKRTRSVAFETSASVEKIDSLNTKTIEEELDERGSEVWDAFREEYYEGAPYPSIPALVFMLIVS